MMGGGGAPPERVCIFRSCARGARGGLDAVRARRASVCGPWRIAGGSCRVASGAFRLTVRVFDARASFTHLPRIGVAGGSSPVSSLHRCLSSVMLVNPLSKSFVLPLAFAILFLSCVVADLLMEQSLLKTTP